MLNQNLKIVILGDSTIDNRVWLGKEKYHLLVNSFYPPLSKLIDYFYWFNPFKPKSVVENLRAQMPTAQIIDRTNDGFTSTDVLNGAYRDKVFGRGTHRFFPHEKFEPLNTDEIKTADRIIISVGGNNFREFIQTALRLHNPEEYIKTEYPKVFQQLQEDYQEILKQIAKNNPQAELILMTQYYPALNQKMLLGTSIYEFMTLLGKIRNLGDALDTIQAVMKDSYQGILQFITHDPSVSKLKVSVVDVTSSLNPHFAENFVGQIEPSDKGGKQIAQMLSYVLNSSKRDSKKIFRFAPAFFSDNKASNVFEANLSEQSGFTPVHPALMPKPTSSWKSTALLVASLCLCASAAFFNAGTLVALTGVMGFFASRTLKTKAYGDVNLYRFKTPENTVEQEKENPTPKTNTPLYQTRKTRELPQRKSHLAQQQKRSQNRLG